MARRHPHADLIIAKANDMDLVVQENIRGVWVDNENRLFALSAGGNYRIKPRCTTKFYRVALLEDLTMPAGVTTQIVYSDDDRDTKFQLADRFLGWLTEWRPYEVGIEEPKNQ